MIHAHHPDEPSLCKACCKTIDNSFIPPSCLVCRECSTQRHYLHEHELLHFDEVPFLECDRCSNSTDSPLFRCVPCNFKLHDKCMELPRVMKHDTHVHPLALQETYVENDSRGYYCEHYEKRRDRWLGAYVYGQCTTRWAFHIKCILPEMSLDKQLRKFFTRKRQSSVIKPMDKRIRSINKEVRKTEEKLKGCRH